MIWSVQPAEKCTRRCAREECCVTLIRPRGSPGAQLYAVAGRKPVSAARAHVSPACTRRTRASQFYCMAQAFTELEKVGRQHDSCLKEVMETDSMRRFWEAVRQIQSAEAEDRDLLKCTALEGLETLALQEVCKAASTCASVCRGLLSALMSARKPD